MDHTLPKLHSKQNIITDIFFEEKIRNLPGKLSTGNDPAINFDLMKCIKKLNILKL